jgi:hypothetical protein
MRPTGLHAHHSLGRPALRALDRGDRSPFGEIGEIGSGLTATAWGPERSRRMVSTAPNAAAVNSDWTHLSNGRAPSGLGLVLLRFRRETNGLFGLGVLR